MIVKFEEGENPSKSIEFDIEHTNDILYVTSNDSDCSYNMTIEMSHKDARDLMNYLQTFFKSKNNG